MRPGLCHRGRNRPRQGPGQGGARRPPAGMEANVEVFLDTNVLMAASVRQHPHFSRADADLRRCLEGEDKGWGHTHSLLEFLSAMTQRPKGRAVPPALVSSLPEQGIPAQGRLVALPGKELPLVQKRAGEPGVIGGIISDFFHLSVVRREGVTRFFTFHTTHFQSLSEPGFLARIVAP